MGWGEKRTKTPQQLDLERRRTLGMQYFSDISELIEIAAKSKRKITRLPPAPHPDDTINPALEVKGPCQEHVQHFKKYRAAKAAGKVVEVVQEDEPEPTEREKKLAAGRAYHKANYAKRPSRGPGKKTKVKKS